MAKKAVAPTVTVKRKEGGSPAWLVRVNGVVSSVCSYKAADREGERKAYRDAMRHKEAVLAEWKERQHKQEQRAATVTEALRIGERLPGAPVTYPDEYDDRPY